MQPFMQSSFAPLAFFGSQSMAVGDFNGDGQPDVAVTNSGANGVNVFLNNEGGLSAMAAIPATGESPTSIAAGDFNGDGKLDLAVANSGSNNVMILLGNGDGTFTAAASPAAGTAPNSIAVADFNGDGVPDLAVANAGSSNVTILRGNGDGTFTAAAGPAGDTGSTSVVAADFNGDGKEDLVVANSRDSSATALLAETALTIATVKNISPVGVGTHLVKAIYSGDVNYGGSTSADVSLTVVPPGLTLRGTSVSVVAGATRTSTLTITPTNGFSGTVTLECDGGGYPGNASDVPTCSSIPPVTISGNAPATTTLTIQTQPGTTPAQYVQYVNAVDSSGNLVANTNTAIVAVTVTAPAPPGLTLSGTPVSVVAGATGTSSLTITPTNGFSGSVTLECDGGSSPGGANDVPTCSSIPPVTISGNAPTTTTLSIQTQLGTTPAQYMEFVKAVDSSGVAMANTTVAVTVTVPAPAPGFAFTNTPVSVVAGCHWDFISHDYPRERLFRNCDPEMQRRQLSGRRKRRAHLLVHPAGDYLGECAGDYDAHYPDTTRNNPCAIRGVCECSRFERSCHCQHQSRSNGDRSRSKLTELHAGRYFSFRRGWRQRDFDDHDQPQRRLYGLGSALLYRNRSSNCGRSAYLLRLCSTGHHGNSSRNDKAHCQHHGSECCLQPDWPGSDGFPQTAQPDVGAWWRGHRCRIPVLRIALTPLPNQDPG